LLKAKYCPRAMPVQHFVNPGQLVQAVSCTQIHTKPHVTLNIDNTALASADSNNRRKEITSGLLLDET